MGDTQVAIRCRCATDGVTMPGAVWTCPTCGHIWQVGSLSAMEAQALGAARRGHVKRVVLSLAACVAACAVAVVIGDIGAAVFVAPAAFGIWLVAVLPHLRRRWRREVEQVPLASVATIIPGLRTPRR